MSFRDLVLHLLEKTLPRLFGRGAGFSNSTAPSGRGREPRRGPSRSYGPVTESGAAAFFAVLGKYALKLRSLSGYGVPAALFAVFIIIAVCAVLMRDPSRSGPFPRTGIGLKGAGRLDRKLAGLEERIKNDPNDIRALFDAGLLKFQKGPESYIGAITDLETARSRGVADIRIFYYLGRMYQAEGLYEFALEEYRRFLNNRPDDLEVRMLLAKLFFSAGKYPLAVREYEALNAVHPKNLVVLENLALSRWKNSQDPKPILDALESLGAEASFRAGYVSGRIGYENKDYAAAAAALARAAAELGKYPEFSDKEGLYRMLGDSYVRLKSEDKAIDALGELLKINPGNDEARSQLARLVKIRDRAAAKKKK